MQLAPVFARYADITNIVSLLLPATVVYILSMAIEAQRGEPSVLCVPPPLSRRVIPLAYTAFLLLLAACIPLKVGLSRFSEGFGNHPALWFLAIGLVAAIALALRLAFPSRGAQPGCKSGTTAFALFPVQWSGTYLQNQPSRQPLRLNREIERDSPLP